MLAHSLRDGGTKKKLAVLITLDTLSADTITELKVRLASLSRENQLTDGTTVTV